MEVWRDNPACESLPVIHSNISSCDVPQPPALCTKWDFFSDALPTTIRVPAATDSADLGIEIFETGSRIYRSFRGLGYGFEAKTLVLRYAFYELRFQKYNIRCLATNQPMIHHAARLGCQEEGRIRRHIYTEGEYRDELIFGLTREEFDELNQRLTSGAHSRETPEAV